VIAGQFETQFVEAGRWRIDRIEDEATADETRCFIR
jgi:hypothetical protein